MHAAACRMLGEARMGAVGTVNNGPLSLTVVSSRDVARAEGEAEAAGGRSRVLALVLTDGAATHSAVERGELPFCPRPGDALQLTKVTEVDGTYLLEPHSCRLLERGPEQAPVERPQLAALWAKGEVDESDPAPRFTELSDAAAQPEPAPSQAAAPRSAPSQAAPRPQATQPAPHVAPPAAPSLGATPTPAQTSGRTAGGRRGGRGATDAAASPASAPPPPAAAPEVPGLDAGLVAELLAAGLSIEEIAKHASQGQ